jgi:2'-5' RNA ligase
MVTTAAFEPQDDESDEDRSFEDPYPHVGKDGTPHSGVMIALVPPDHVAQDLAVEGGEDPYDLHVTLAYLGKTDEVSHDKAHWAMCEVARRIPPLKGKINGFGDFSVEPEKNDGFSHVHLGLVDIPHVGEVYGHMLEALRTVGLEPSHDHGISPHMSIQYSHEPMEYEEMPKTTGEEFDIPHITLGYGGTWRHYPLSGGGIEKTSAQETNPYRALVHHIRKHINKSGGMTLHPETGVTPRSGYQVALPGHTMEPRPTHREFMDPAKTDEMAERVKHWLGSKTGVFDHHDVHIGVWHNKDNDQIYLDGSRWVQGKGRAVRAGADGNQISIWDNRNEREIETGGTGEFDAPVPHQAMLETWLW